MKNGRFDEGVESGDAVTEVGTKIRFWWDRGSRARRVFDDEDDEDEDQDEDGVGVVFV